MQPSKAILKQFFAHFLPTLLHNLHCCKDKDQFAYTVATEKFLVLLVYSY